jgi:hypothetical protein
MATGGNAAATTLSGEWQLKMTVEAPTGTMPAGLPKVGTTELQTVSLSTVCTPTGQCTATLAPSAGGILPLYDNSVDFIWYPSTGLTHTRSSYSGTTPRSGYGGPGIPPCPPPSDLQHDVLTLTVLQAVPDAAGGWRATVISGTEVSPEGWVCVGAAGQSTGAAYVNLLAVPVGQTLPPSTSLSCAAPASVTAATNPDVSTFSSALATPAQAFGSPLPAGLAVAAICVLISRLSSFEPGYLYGLIAGLAFQGTLPKHEQGHTVAIAAIAGLSIAVVAWLLWIPVGRAAAAHGAPFAVVMLADLLGSVFVGGLVGNVIGLMPLRFLPGGTLMESHRGAWAATFGIAVFGLIEVELRPQSVSAHPGSAPVVTAVVLFVFFGGITAGLRWYFSRREHGRDGGEEKPAGPPPAAQGAAVASSSSEATVPAPATAASSATTGAPPRARRKQRDHPPAPSANA